MSYYKYKERVSADQQAVDYSLIQSGAQEGFEAIQEEQSRKQADKEVKIAELREVASKEILAAEEAVRSNKGDKSKDSFNAQVLSMAHQSAQHMKALEKLMRAGKINPSDFAIQRQNLTDSVTQLRVVTAAYKDSVNQAVQRQQSTDGKQPQAGALEAFNMSEVQKIIDLKDRSLSVDPVTGMVRMSHVDGSSVSMGEVQVRMMNKYDRYDLKEGATKYAKDVGLVTIQDGRVTISDAFTEVDDRNLDKTIRTTWVDGLSNEAQASVLLDNSSGYEAVQADNQAELDGIIKSKGLDREKVVWLQPNYETEGGRLNAEFTPDQRDEIGNKSVDMMRTLLPYKKTERDPRPPSDSSIKAKEGRDTEIRNAKKNINLLHDIYTGDTKKKNLALASFSKDLKKQYGNKFRSIKIAGGKIEITAIKQVSDGLGGFKDQAVTEPIEIPTNAGDFKKFVETVGKSITGDDTLMSRYDEVIGEIEGDTGAGYKNENAGFEIEISEGQVLPPIADVLEELDKISFWPLTSIPNKATEVGKYIDAYAIASKIKDLKYEFEEVKEKDDEGKETGDVSTGPTITIKHPSIGTKTIRVDKAQSKMQATIDKVLREIHEAAGKTIDSSTDSLGIM